MGTIGTFDASKHVREELVLRITLGQAFKLRLWLACQMMRLIALVCPLEVEVVERD